MRVHPDHRFDEVDTSGTDNPRCLAVIPRLPEFESRPYVFGASRISLRPTVAERE